MSALHEIAVKALDGAPLDLGRFAGRALLVVNVASKCGLTPQYEGLQRLHDRYRDRGFSVLGVPCNQFAGQEPGTPEEVAAFCSSSYAVTFPLTEKLDVNGRRRHPLYRELAATPDADGEAGDVRWNFEKFLVSPDGEARRALSPQDRARVRRGRGGDRGPAPGSRRRELGGARGFLAARRAIASASRTGRR